MQKQFSLIYAPIVNLKFLIAYFKLYSNYSRYTSTYNKHARNKSGTIT